MTNSTQTAVPSQLDAVRAMEKLPVPEALDSDLPGLADDIPPVDAPKSWDYDSDVIIVGGGGAGLSAAAAALRNGSTVTVLEKQSVTGGHSQHAAMAASFNTEASRRNGLPFDRQAAYRHSFVNQSNATVDPRLVTTLIDRAHEIYDWSETESWDRRWEPLPRLQPPVPPAWALSRVNSMASARARP